MDIVIEFLFQLTAKQVDDWGLVVRYDPKQAYGATAVVHCPPNTTRARNDFKDEPRRVENHYLKSELNDGGASVLTTLHELVPWKEPKKYWEELLEGKYEWSSIGKQLREKGIVK
jgi:hypothetical protein